jgi:hypothetical protein
VQTTSHDPMVGRRFRVGVCLHTPRSATIVAEGTFGPGADLTLGADASAGLTVPGWEGGAVLLISEGTLLHLEPGMRLHMCGDGGEGRVKGTFEELAAQGMTSPIRITVSKVNILVREGISVYVNYLEEGAVPGPRS